MPARRCWAHIEIGKAMLGNCSCKFGSTERENQPRSFPISCLTGLVVLALDRPVQFQKQPSESSGIHRF
jgi:hypothetical protein